MYKMMVVERVVVDVKKGLPGNLFSNSGFVVQGDDHMQLIPVSNKRSFDECRSTVYGFEGCDQFSILLGTWKNT